MPSKAKRWALVIGVDQYRDGQISALKGSVNDAHALAGALVQYAGFPVDQVIVLTTDQAEERQPTRINILTYLSNLASLVPKDGLLLISFAGHGIERGGQAYLIPSDARLSHDISLLEESAVSVTRMHDRIKSIGVGQVIVLLDACRNDPGGRADAPNNLSLAYTKFNFDVRNREVEAFATFYATAIGQRAYEYTEKRQGYFTWALVEGLKGGAANEKGEVSLAALVKYVQDNVPKRVAIDLGASEQQKPFAIVDGYRADELIVALGGANAGNATSSPAAASVDPAAMELIFWDSIKNSSDPSDFKAYLDRFPDGTFAALARKRGVASSPATGSAAPLPSVDEILEANIKALGGKAAFEKVTTLVFRGLVEVTAGGKTFNGTMEVNSKFPDKSWTSTNVPKLDNSVQVFDGTVGWRKDEKGLTQLNDWQIAFMKRNTALSYLTEIKQFKAFYPKARVKGKEKIGNRDAYVVEVEPVGSTPETLYFDMETGLAIRWDLSYQSSASQKGVGIPMQLFIDEYADVNGIKVASVIRQMSSGVTFLTRFFDVKYNVAIDDAKFAKPK
ncbi:MAG TPA: caspase family protein [Pyrinomonadaceae bacterium]|nr:caspase family protein [Pyrinomonadaceae bacterium]